MGAAGWAVLAFTCLGLRVLAAIAVGARWVPAWSGPPAEVLLWIGVPALIDPPVLRNPGFWIGFVVMLILWAPVIDRARRRPALRSKRAAQVVVAAIALAVQAALAQGLVAGTVAEATGGTVCQWPRKITNIGGDLFPLPPGTTLTLCVQGRPGGGYIGDYPGPPG